MYLPKKFQGDWQKVVEEYPLGALLTVVEGEILTSFLPFHLGDEKLFAHFAIGNLHWKVIEEKASKLLFQGPQAYVSPTWYTSCDVPTWNYVAVEMDVVGKKISIDETIEGLKEMSALYEGGDGWEFAIPPDIRDLSKAIVGVSFEIKSVQAKWKLSQNRSNLDREGVIRGLRTRKEKMDLLLADWMEKIE